MTSVTVRHGGNRRRERGASLVEFALIAPLLFAILLGTITGGLALSKKNSMTNAVREGGRLGATLFSDDEDWTWDDWADAVRQRVLDLAGNDLDEGDVCVQLVKVDDASVLGQRPAGGCPPPPTMPSVPPTPASAMGCLVKVWARTSADLETIFFSRPLTLDAQSVALYERTEDCP
jgi:Flp pilus assembly pilin Flp